MDDANTIEKITEAIKKASFDEMALAWNIFDQAMESLDRSETAASFAALLQKAVDHGINSLCVLYSGTANAEGKPEILVHLIREKHPCFRECDPTLLKKLNEFTENSSLHGKGGALSRSESTLARQVETLLKSVESYNFQVRKSIYYTQEAYHRDTRRWRFTAVFLSLSLLVIAFLYLVYRNEKPMQEYVTKGQFFWLTQPGHQETEEISLRFKVFADGDFHDYTVSAVEPISLVALRLDPCDEKRAQIWIDSLVIETRTPEKNRFFSFDENVEKWYTKQDALSLKVREGSLLVRTTGRDAAIRIDDMPMTDIVAFRLRMKVVLYKSFLQWIFS